jgi:hypothetical protein
VPPRRAARYSAGIPGPMLALTSSMGTTPQVSQTAAAYTSPPAQAVCRYRMGGSTGEAHSSPHSVRAMSATASASPLAVRM